MRFISRERLIKGGKIFLLAFVVAIIVRGCCFQSFKIGSAAMEGALYENEYVFVQKMSYGARLPISLFSVPFLHNTIPFTSVPSYSTSIQLPYMRLPGRMPTRGDLLVFNSPENTDMPIDKRKRLLSRCLAMSGDSIAFDEQYVLVNGVASLYPHQKHCYRVMLNGVYPDYKFLKKYDIRWGKSIVDNYVYIFALSRKMAATLDSCSKVSNVSPINMMDNSKDHNFTYIYSFDKMGISIKQPFIIPKKGKQIVLNKKNCALYASLINKYEGVQLTTKNNAYAINSIVADKYTFKQNYFFVVNDNSVFTDDSRKWGLLPESHIIGKAANIWFSKSKQAIRWERIFMSCK